MKILVIQNDLLGPAGLVGDRFLEAGCSVEYVIPANGGVLPETAGGHDALLVLGGPQSVMDRAEHTWMAGVMDLIRQFGDGGKPVLGLCLGAQLIAAAWGAEIKRMPLREYGFTRLKKTATGEADPVLAGTTSTPVIMEFHEDRFEIPDNAVHLMESDHCASQAFRVGDNVYAFQCHFEVNKSMARDWAGLSAAQDALLENGIDEDPLERMDVELANHYDSAEEFARTVTDQWLKISTRDQMRTTDRPHDQAAE